jgi:endonuclease YncB( thermonuclease family)
MRPLALGLTLLAVLAPHLAGARHRGASGVPATVIVDGVPTRVRWTDGDTFRIDEGAGRGRSARLVGVNALETYGPVHRFGRLSPAALLAIAKGSAALAASEPWTCAAGRSDGYGRLLVSCPGAASLLVRRGQAMVFAVDGPADPALLALQREAQAEGVGLWAGGVPREIVTSVHSAGERGLGPRGAYDRVVDTRTGVAAARPHARVYAVCEEVCAGSGRDESCLVYVPFERRYRDRPPCLTGPER